MDADDAFVSNISRRTDVDTNGYLDVIAHGTPNGIQITHNGQHMTVDHRHLMRKTQAGAKSMQSLKNFYLMRNTVRQGQQ